jgi:HK97 gp10 family phage protein
MVNATVNLIINKAAFDSLINEATKVTEHAADVMANEMKKSILTGAKSGQQYFSNGRRHQSSAPGQAPANNTGALVRSIKVKKNGREATISIEKDYAIYLEFGTSKMRPRPFIIPAFLKTKKWFSDKLKAIASKGK